MAELNDILDSKLARLDSVPEDFVTNIQKAEKGLVREINLLLGQFDRDSSGFILTNAKNLRLVNNLKGLLEEVFVRSDYVAAVRAFAGEFDSQKELNEVYYKALLEYVESSELAVMSQVSKSQAVDLLLGGAIDQQFYDPIVNLMTEAVNTSAPFVDTVEAIKVITEGGEQANGTQVMGRLSRYAKQISYDAMAITDRTYNQQVVRETGTQFYRYTGGTISDTRHFCLARNGKFFHVDEIADWGNLTWPEKHRGTNSGTIFTFLGGYNCRHSIIPTPLSQVPKDDLRRNLTNGNLTLTDAEREVLGI